MAFWNRGRQGDLDPTAPPAPDPDFLPALSPLHLACSVDWRCSEVKLVDRNTGKQFNQPGMILTIQAKPVASNEEITYEFFMTDGDVMTVGEVIGQMMRHAMGHYGHGMLDEGCGAGE